MRSQRRQPRAQLLDARADRGARLPVGAGAGAVLVLADARALSRARQRCHGAVGVAARGTGRSPALAAQTLAADQLAARPR